MDHCTLHSGWGRCLWSDVVAFLAHLSCRPTHVLLGERSQKVDEGVAAMQACRERRGGLCSQGSPTLGLCCLS